MKKIKAGILGATGMVGQRFVQLLHDHPWFEVAEVAASERSAGKKYSEAVAGRWKIEPDIPPEIADMTVRECSAGLDCGVVFSALDSEFAFDIEREFAENGCAVLSNTKCYRMEPYVPLLIPEVNAGHLEAVKLQKEMFGDGFIVTNPNCSTIGMCVALAPLHRKFGVRNVVVSTMQALSGAGYPGVASLDIVDNVLPYIKGEEEKVETETLKILGGFDGRGFGYAKMKVSAHCNRVGVKDGHLETVSVKLGEKPSADELARAMASFNPLKGLGLPTAPDPPIIVMEQPDRPQPRHDRDRGRGMAVSVGRIRECNVLDYRFAVLSHNTIRGAAGASVLNAELLKAKGYLKV